MTYLLRGAPGTLSSFFLRQTFSDALAPLPRVAGVSFEEAEIAVKLRKTTRNRFLVISWFHRRSSTSEQF